MGNGRGPAAIVMKRFSLLLFVFLLPLLAMAQPDMRVKSITVESNGIMKEITSPPNPAAGYQKLFFKTTGLFVRDSAGAETGPLAAAGAATSTNVPWGNTIYVDAVNGNDSTAIIGNAAKPYLTVSNAWRAIANNSRLVIRAGTYIQEVLGASVVADNDPAPLNLIGKTNVVIEGYGAIITNTAASGQGPFMAIGSNTFNVVIAGLKIHQRKVAGTSITNNTAMVLLKGLSSNITFIDCEFVNAGSQGISQLGTTKPASYVSIKDCYFFNVGSTNAAWIGGITDGAGVAGIGPYWTIEGCTFKGNSRDVEMEGFTVGQTAKGVKIRGNRSEACIGDASISVFGNGSATYSYSDYEISGNTIVDGAGGGNLTQRGIYITEGTRGLIHGNVINNYEYGIHILAASVSNSFGTITANTITGIRVTGVELDEHTSQGVGSIFGWQISGNKIGDCGYYGIDLIGVKNNTVQGNYIYNCSTNSISSDGAISLRWFSGTANHCTNNAIMGNYIADFQSSVTTDAGIKITAGVTNTYILGNHFYRVTTQVDDSGTGTQNIWFNPVSPTAGQALVSRNGAYSNETVSGSGDVTAAATLTADQLVAGDGSKAVKTVNPKINSSGDLFFVAANTNLSITTSNRIINYGYSDTSGPSTNRNGIYSLGDGSIPSQFYMFESNGVNYVLQTTLNQLGAKTTNIWSLGHKTGPLVSTNGANGNLIGVGDTTGSAAYVLANGGTIGSEILSSNITFTSALLVPQSNLTNITADFAFAERHMLMTNKVHVSAIANNATADTDPRWMTIKLENLSGSTQVASVSPSMKRAGTNFVNVANGQALLITLRNHGAQLSNTLATLTLYDSP